MYYIFRKYKVIIILTLVMIGSYYLYKSDLFQKKFFPKKYWQKQIKLLSSEINILNFLLKDTYIELMKLRLTSELDIARDANFFKTTGLDSKHIEILLNQSIKEIKEKEKVLLEEIKSLRKEIEEKNKKLNYAKKIFKKLQEKK